MPRNAPRLFVLIFLTLASSACGSGTAAQKTTATVTLTLTQFVLPPKITPTPTASQSAETATPNPLSPTLTLEVSGIESITPIIETTGTAHPAALPSASRCNDAKYVSDVTIPDGTVMAPDKEFTKTWRFKNTGTCRWTTSYAIGFAYGIPMGGTDTRLPNSVDPGSTVDISVEITAPTANGWYGGWWRLKSDTGNYFGDFVYVSIMVSDGRETSTPNS